MAKSFAQYASQFLNHQQNPASSLSSSQPLFFSFTTDEGSRAGGDDDADLDDVDDPHLRQSSRGSYRSRANDVDEEDPYLRLDEGEFPPGASYRASQSIPLMASDYGQAESQDYPKGWLAHQTSPPRRVRSPLRSPSSSSLDSSSPAVESRRLVPDLSARYQLHPPPPPRAHEPVSLSLSLTQSLLPRDGTSRPVDVFSLPDPRHITRSRRKFNDSHWTIVWCTGVSICVFFSVLLLFLVRDPDNPSRVSLPYTTLLHTVPLLTILTFMSALVAYVHVFLLRIFVRPVMVATSVFIPATLLISAIWAFVGSFMWDGNQDPTWGETVG